MVVGLRVESENIRTGSKKHCNSTYFTMVAKDENGNNAPIPGITLTSEDEVRRYVRNIVRRNEGKKTKSRFSPETFKMSEYISHL